MLPFIRWFFRPAGLIIISIGLVGAAVLIVFRPDAGVPRPQRPPLQGGDQEIAFVYPATSAIAWDRFVSGVRLACERLQNQYPGLKVHQSAARAGGASIPEVILEWHDSTPRRLVFRWYKLTSAWTAEVWMKELLRPPYPLAVIGGSNSNRARDLALAMRRACGDGSLGVEKQIPQHSTEPRPLLLLTTATADRVSPSSAEPSNASQQDVELTSLYPDRTFRFCFTNRQMATAVTRFIWQHHDLRPEADPAYAAQWMDDSYSVDLFMGYNRVLDRRARDNLVQQWGFVSGCLAMGLPPAVLPGWYASGLRPEGGTYPLRILSGIGPFSSPNPYEAEESRKLLADLKPREGSDSLKRLLVITGQAQPSRRFLRDLARSAPGTVQRLVVASGDAISFNTVYRDRMVSWPIQDLPFKFVFFCHRNPIDRNAGFRPLDPQGGPPDPPSACSGTDDLLMLAEIVEAVALAHGYNGIAKTPSELAAGLRALRLRIRKGSTSTRLTFENKGRPLFNAEGMRQGGTGEHVVCLRPRVEDERVLPEATIEVWVRGSSDGINQRWQRVGEPLVVSYVERKTHREGIHVNR